MDTLTAVLIAESADFADSEEQYIEAWQHLVNTGLAWQLQGWVGRTAQAYIDNGYIQSVGMQYAQ